MKSKFKYLLSYSLKKKIDTKWFKVVNVLLCLLLVFLINMDFFINLFGGDFDQKEKIYVVDNVNGFNTFKSTFDEFAKQLEMDDYEISLDNTILEKKDDLDEEIIVVINNNSTEYLQGEIISYDTVSRTTYEVITSSLNALKSEIVFKTSGLSPAEISKLTNPVNIKETVLNEDAKDNQTKENLSSIITTIVIVPFFILIVTMVQMLGAEINDEKTSRGMEIIISSIPAKMHFISKVLSALLYVLIQGCLLFLYVLLAVLLRKLFMSSATSAGVGGMITELVSMLKNTGTLELLAKGAIVLVILYIISFITYAIVAATLASMTTNNEDFQQLQTPLMIIMLIGYYIALMAVVFDGAVFINILAYIPLLSVMIAPTLYLLGEISLLSLVLITFVTGIVTYLLYIYGLRIYKVGILNYSSSKLWTKIFKSIRKEKKNES